MEPKSFKKWKIEKVEGRIAEAESELEKAGYRLADPEVYADAEKVAEIHAAQTELQASISELYTEWERANDELTALTDVTDPSD